MGGFFLASSAAVAAATLLVLWVRAMKQVSMGEHLRLLDSIASTATILGIVAFAGDPGIVGGVLASSGIIVGATYLGLGYFLSAQSTQAPTVSVGAPLPAFAAPDENGEMFDIASVSGSSTFLKFFRGHW